MSNCVHVHLNNGNIKYVVTRLATPLTRSDNGRYSFYRTFIIYMITQGGDLASTFTNMMLSHLCSRKGFTVVSFHDDAIWHLW